MIIDPITLSSFLGFFRVVRLTQTQNVIPSRIFYTCLINTQSTPRIAPQRFTEPFAIFIPFCLGPHTVWLTNPLSAEISPLVCSSVCHPADHGADNLHQVHPTHGWPAEWKPLGQQGRLYALYRALHRQERVFRSCLYEHALKKEMLEALLKQLWMFLFQASSKCSCTLPLWRLW